VDITVMSIAHHAHASPPSAAAPHAQQQMKVTHQTHGAHNQTPSKQAPGKYQARHPEQSLFYRTIAGHVET
jgi:hypothetical protein